MTMTNTARSFTVRPAAEADSAGILACLHAAFEAYRSSYSVAAFADTVLTPATLQQRVATMRLFVAVSEVGEVIGTIGCQVVEASANSKEGHIRGMAVLPAWQGSGVAAQLLQSAEGELRTRGCSWISLDTTEPLVAAQRFYEKNGFSRSGKVTDFFGMPLIEYIKTLTG
ncbi:MAG: GNAT family N-acetyltransferase [Terriglobales bacterium]